LYCSIRFGSVFLSIIIPSTSTVNFSFHIAPRKPSRIEAIIWDFQSSSVSINPAIKISLPVSSLLNAGSKLNNWNTGEFFLSPNNRSLGLSVRQAA
jgi:hypothetical protein